MADDVRQAGVSPAARITIRGHPHNGHGDEARRNREAGHADLVRPIQSGDVNLYLCYVFAAVLVACLIAGL